MDKGRQIDKAQNQNAVYIDQYGKGGHTSTKVIHAPGGEDHWSFGWGNDNNNQNQQPKAGRKRFNDINSNASSLQNNNNDNKNNNNNPGFKPSVRVNNNPGGKSNIVFGNDDTNYDHYRK
jgi:hypothetical protein